MRTLLIGISAVSLLAVPLAGVSHAGTSGADGRTADTAPHNGPGPEVLRRQAGLDRLADLIEAGITHGESHHDRGSGFAGSLVDADAGRLTVYWKGDVPGRVRAAAKTAPKGLKVEFKSAPYSAAELEAARDRLSAAGATSAPLTSVATLPTGAGLDVTYAPAAGSSLSAAAENSSGIVAEVERVAQVPITASVARDADALSRHDDWSPWFAGAELNTPSHSFCSSGFAGWKGGRQVLLTASHCGTSGTFADGTGEVVGWATDYSLNYDTTFIELNGDGGNGYYDGRWDDTNGYYKHVSSWGLSRAGDYVCTSGAMSGVKCNIKVKYAGVESVIGGIKRYNVVQAMRTDTSTHAAAQGDSGGPVVTSADGTYGFDMQARGVISGSWGGVVVCPLFGVDIAGETTCYEGVQYIGLYYLVNNLGFSVNT
ncbi:hypothetical protein ACGFX4_21965 [Kitasatospora sp. NPDC048365]|uniref:hypothetical protein n=1 Tax=Kitasatospora sp. NPDC048365 TaxID=3364050 RepID=UPI00371666B8